MATDFIREKPIDGVARVMTEPAPVVRPVGRILFPNAVVFLSNACIMTIELVAGRILAPRMGVSLYTWTSVIGVILAGVSVGNIIGGWVADRARSPRWLAVLFVLAAAASLSVLPIATMLDNRVVPENFPIIERILGITAIIFFLPSLMLGTISPVVIKLTLADLSRTGNVIGRIYASSALGSILGTFLTGYTLISLVGTRVIITGVAVVLLLLAAWVSRPWTRSWAVLQTLIVVAMVGTVFLLNRNGLYQTGCKVESNYYCVKIHDQIQDNRQIKVLVLDRLVHSFVDPKDPTYIGYGYERIYQAVMDATVTKRASFSSMFIGGGGYTFPRYIEALYSGPITVAEIDPAVTEINYRELGLPRTTRIKTYNEDAREFLRRSAEGRGPAGEPARYDLLVGDAFNDYSVPYHLTTLEFDQIVHKLMAPDGLYMINIIDGRSGGFWRAIVKTMQQVFPHVYAAPTISEWRTNVRTTWVIVGSDQDMPLGMGQNAAPNQYIGQFLTPAELASALAEAPAVLLTDDHNPADNLLAPVFADSGF